MVRNSRWAVCFGLCIVVVYAIAVWSKRGTSVPHWFEIGPDSFWCVTRQAATELQMKFMELVLGLATAAIALQVTFRERVLGEEDGKKLTAPLKFQLSAVSFLLAVVFAASYQGLGANIIRESCAPRWSLALEAKLKTIEVFCAARNAPEMRAQVDRILERDEIVALAGTQDWEILRSALDHPAHAKAKDWNPCDISRAKFSVPQDAKLTHETSTARQTYVFAILCFLLGAGFMVAHLLRGK